MATLNQLQPIESALPPQEAEWFRRNAPHFLEALRLQQTVIQQLVVRVGGPGSGSGVVDLGDLTDAVDQLENQDQEALLAALSARVSELEQQVHELLSDANSDTRAIDAIEDMQRDTPVDLYPELLKRIEALEAQL